MAETRSDIPFWARRLVNDEGLKRISEAVARVEKRTSAEIVPMLVHSCSTTGHVSWILFLALLMLSWLILPRFMVFTPEWPEWIWEVWSFIGAAVLTMVLSRSMRVRRWLTTDFDQILSVERRALLEFHVTQVQETEHRTGVLIMASALERRAIVIADRAIDERLPKSTWSEAVRLLISKTKQGDFAGGMVAAIEALGSRLEKAFPARPDEKAELHDALIIKS